MPRQRTRISARRVETLLFPIAAFLRAGGFSKKSAMSHLAVAYQRSERLVGARRIEHIGDPMLYADVVSRWSHDARFLDANGCPRSLSFEGKNELRALIRKVDSKCDPHFVVRVLIRFGNIRRGAKGKYRLVRPLFFTSTTSAMAFEPIAYFLSDASSTLGRILRRTRRTRTPELFWRKVECSGLSTENARRFVEFVRERGQDFLEEIDDWLEARARRQPSGKRSRRVGLGLFSIDSQN